MPLETLNQALFKMVAAGHAAEPHLLVLARWLAVWGIVGVPVILGCLWLWRPKERDRLLLSTVAGCLALMATEVIAALVGHPRPFMTGLSPVYLAHSAEGSFPSAHASLMFTVAGGLLVPRRTAPWGGVLALLGVATAWARVYLGLHFPFDILGSALLAAALTAAWGSAPPAWAAFLRERVEHVGTSLKRAFQPRISGHSGSGVP